MKNLWHLFHFPSWQKESRFQAYNRKRDSPWMERHRYFLQHCHEKSVPGMKIALAIHPIRSDKQITGPPDPSRSYSSDQT